MRIAIASGKGGKTSICAALTSLAAPCAVADCDVDAVDLHLVLEPVQTGAWSHTGDFLARVKAARCTRISHLELADFPDRPRGQGGAVNSSAVVVIYVEHRVCRADAEIAVEVGNPGCTGCGECQALCRFDAIEMVADLARIDPMAREGCGVCADHCPFQAVRLEEVSCGTWFEATSRNGHLVHARLAASRENSGKLVTTVRTEAREVDLACQR